MWRAVNLVEFADVDTCAFFLSGQDARIPSNDKQPDRPRGAQRGGEVTKTVITKELREGQRD
jgi:hypothetical protein